MEKHIRLWNRCGEKWNYHLRRIISGFEILIKKGLNRTGFRISEQIYISSQLSSLLSAGISIHESLVCLADQSNSKKQSRFFNESSEKILLGEKLSDILISSRGWHPFAVALIKVGEMSGTLSESFSLIAEELTGRRDLRRKLISALLYPLCIGISAFGLISTIVAFVFPKILPILQNVRGELPLSTRIIIFATEFVKAYGIISAIILLVIFSLAVFILRRIKSVKKVFEYSILFLPFFGDLFRTYSVSNILKTLNVLTSGGMRHLDAVGKITEISASAVYREALERSVEKIERGESFADSLRGNRQLFPKLSINMLSTGEKTGLLPEISGRISKMYADEFTSKVEALSRLVEPVLMMLLGLAVGFIAVSIISPIYEITSNVR